MHIHLRTPILTHKGKQNSRNKQNTKSSQGYINKQNRIQKKQSITTLITIVVIIEKAILKNREETFAATPSVKWPFIFFLFACVSPKTLPPVHAQTHTNTQARGCR
jgi:hypothetical protein